MAGNGKRVGRRANSLVAAQQMCLDHAMKRHNRALKTVADLMGRKYDTLHNWLTKAGLPVGELRRFETACGASHVTEFLCLQAHFIPVAMPSGKSLQETDLVELQASFAEAMGLLIRYHRREAEQEATLGALDTLMGEIAWQRANVERARSPELELFGGGA